MCFKNPEIRSLQVSPRCTGKSTLMDVLADRKTAGTISGDIRVLGRPKERHTFARILGCE